MLKFEEEESGKGTEMTTTARRRLTQRCHATSACLTPQFMNTAEFGLGGGDDDTMTPG